jgi:hypothetical protein
MRYTAESRSKSQTKLDAEKEAIRVLRGYLSNHVTRLNYRQRLADGKSIGNGQIEGVCKKLIGRRLLRWREKVIRATKSADCAEI